MQCHVHAFVREILIAFKNTKWIYFKRALNRLDVVNSLLNLNGNSNAFRLLAADIIVLPKSVNWSKGWNLHQSRFQGTLGKAARTDVMVGRLAMKKKKKDELYMH